jgi:hypothetical protein
VKTYIDGYQNGDVERESDLVVELALEGRGEFDVDG